MLTGLVIVSVAEMVPTFPENEQLLDLLPADQRSIQRFKRMGLASPAVPMTAADSTA